MVVRSPPFPLYLRLLGLCWKEHSPEIKKGKRNGEDFGTYEW